MCFKLLVFDNQGHLPPEYPTDHVRVYKRDRPKKAGEPTLVAVGNHFIGTICWCPSLGGGSGSYALVGLREELGTEEKREVENYCEYLNSKAPKGPTMDQVLSGEGGLAFICVEVENEKHRAG